jgi:hypothetical protein
LPYLTPIKLFTICLGLLISGILKGQILDDSLESRSAYKRLYRAKGSTFNLTENTIGVYPSVKYSNDFVLGLGLSRAKFNFGEGGGNGAGVNLTTEYYFQNNIIAPKLSIWKSSFAFIFGICGSVGTQYFIQNRNTAFAFTPEIGIGFYKVFILYQYSAFMHNNIGQIPKHGFSLAYYYTFIPGRKY